MGKKYEIVSLGVNCLPRTILTRNGVKPAKAEGELSCPFDLVKHEPKRIIHYLKNNFKDYFDDIFFVTRKRNIFDFRKKGLWQKTDGTKFFHDKDCKAEDLEKLTNRIKRRINNFNSIMNSERPILFVCSTFDEVDFVDELYTTLEQLRGNKSFKLAVINFSDSIPPPRKGLYTLDLALPNKTYQTTWNKTQFVKSDLGEYVERCITSFVEKILKRDFQEI